jgi:hypothetical protein
MRKPLKLCYDAQVECVKTYKFADDKMVFRKGAFYWVSLDELWFVGHFGHTLGAVVALEGLKNHYDGRNTGGWFFVYEKSKSDETYRCFGDYFKVNKDILEKELFEI